MLTCALEQQKDIIILHLSDASAVQLVYALVRLPATAQCAYCTIIHNNN